MGVATWGNTAVLLRPHGATFHHPARIPQEGTQDAETGDRHRRAADGRVSGGREMSTSSNVRFEDWEAEQMKDPEFRAAAEELEPAYQVARLRIMRGLTQEQLAALVGTKQPSIARLESGKVEPKLSFLRRVVEALGARLEVRIVPLEGRKTG